MTLNLEATTPARLPDRSRHLSWMVVSLVLLVLAVAIALVTLHLRELVRAQIIQQDGIILFSRTMITKSLKEELEGLDADSEPEILFHLITERILEEAQERAVLAVRVFNEEGEYDFGIPWSERDLSSPEMERLRDGRTINSFNANGDLAEAGHSSTGPVPLIQALIPLEYRGAFLGAAEFILDGQEVARALARMDRHLLLYGLLSFLVGGGITTGALTWAFGRLQRTNKMLEQRTESLLRANHELTLAAKTSAVGAITAHLIHDLKSPLFGLQSFVSARGSADEEDWDTALDTTHRMQRVIAEIVRILREEKTSEAYELSVSEVFSLIRKKLEEPAREAGIELIAEAGVAGTLMNRDANIILLVITNLVQNAIQATPRGGRIAVTATTAGDQALFEVADTGAGISALMQPCLFTPTRSTKADGSGLGLAISKQLASHIGAELILKETSSSGTIFQLRVPARVLNAELAAD